MGLCTNPERNGELGFYDRGAEFWMNNITYLPFGKIKFVLE